MSLSPFLDMMPLPFQTCMFVDGKFKDTAPFLLKIYFEMTLDPFPAVGSCVVDVVSK